MRLSGLTSELIVHLMSAELCINRAAPGGSQEGRLAAQAAGLTHREPHLLWTGGGRGRRPTVLGAEVEVGEDLGNRFKDYRSPVGIRKRVTLGQKRMNANHSPKVTLHFAGIRITI